MKRHKGFAAALAVLLFCCLPSCMLAKDWFNDTEEASEAPSLTPEIFRPTDVKYGEPMLVFALAEGVELFTAEADVDIGAMTEEDEPLEASDTLIKSELVTAFGEDASGLYYIVQNQRQVVGYALKERFDFFAEAEMYACAYTPGAGVNRATLVELGLFLPENVVLEPALTKKDNYIDKDPVMTKAWLLADLKLARKLEAAAALLAEKGYTLKITGGYYPQSVRYDLYNKVAAPALIPDPKLESLPPTGRCAEVTLLDASGKELVFPSALYEFVPQAKRPFQGSLRDAAANMKILDEAMEAAGLEPSGGFWWEYIDPETDFDPMNVSEDEMILTAHSW